MKRYAIINYDALYEDVTLDLIETNIERDTEEWEELIESYETNHGTLIVMDGDKFVDTIKMADLTKFAEVKKEEL